MAEGPRPASGDWKKLAIAALLGILIGALAMAAASGYFVRSYLLNHPEILPEAMERLQEREMASAVGQNRAAIETPFHGAWAGAEDPDVILVEFFDYACGFCRASNPDIERLLREDRRLRVVWREWPVLGPDSEAAAGASLAAARQGRYKQYYDALFALGRPTAANVEQALRQAGIDPAQAEAFRGTAEVRSELERNHALARSLGATGTPTFTVGDQVLSGAVGYEALREAIEKAREG
ncbi:DsbA family protein [Allosphingosinicella sp.]|jgi:protein-disulfide isomerase|uniref:DsbA family protein n=1 Tax=Allosphingosinicella sp. TaxID=2823234 RepID=UPI002F0B20D4